MTYEGTRYQDGQIRVKSLVQQVDDSVSTSRSLTRHVNQSVSVIARMHATSNLRPVDRVGCVSVGDFASCDVQAVERQTLFFHLRHLVL